VFQETLGDNGVLLYPSHPFPAVYHYSSILRPFNFGYWAIFNVLKLPVTQVPMGLSKDGLPLGIQVHTILQAKVITLLANDVTRHVSYSMLCYYKAVTFLYI